jgi:Na+-transporting NADH:ubiquinone oxidoreductase subunit C
MTVVCAGLLGGTANGLKEKITAAKKLDARKQILGAVTEIEGQDVNALYESNIKGYVVNSAGDVVETEENKKGEQIPVIAEEINPRTEYKKSSLGDKLFPVFEYSEGGKVQAYVLPIYGNGLWDEVWGYIAIEPDFKTVKGIGFGHKAETPGLGARITEGEVQNRFKGKTIYSAAGEVKLNFMKGEKNADIGESDVDGLSGASMTTKGVNAMLANYLSYYKAYFDKAGNATPVKEEVKVEEVVPAPVVTDSTATDSNAVAVVADSLQADTSVHADNSSAIDSTQGH